MTRRRREGRASREPESEALLSWINDTETDWVSSDLARTELIRAVRRVVPERAVRAREVLESVTLIEVTTQTFEEAARIDPPLVRSLDALHLAVALDLGDDLAAFVTYDARLALAAALNGVATIAPS